MTPVEHIIDYINKAESIHLDRILDQCKKMLTHESIALSEEFEKGYQKGYTDGYLTGFENG